MTRAEHAGSVVSLGRPISNTQVYLLNRDLEPVPLGVAGELYTGGDGLARGYHNRPDLTAERFIPHPYGKPGERLYRTGDVARYLTDGRIEFVGRLDHQVKVRGFRIELEEIEVALAAHSAVRQCVVLAREDGGREKQLVAYVLLEADRELTGTEMRAYLGQHLPEYMIPSQLVVLETFPLTANGKVDRRALPAPGEARELSQDEFVAPRTPVEKALVEIWQEVLGVERVSVNDNFFDLGGDSIRSIQVHAQAEEHGYQFSVRDLLQLQTIAELACVTKRIDAGIDRAFKTEPFSLVRIDDRQKLPEDIEDAYPLSFLQRGMLYHTNLSGQLALYHVIFSCLIRGPLEVAALRAALQRLAAQHPVLRASFDLHSYSEPLQLVHKRVTVPFAITDLKHLPATDRKATLVAWQEEDKKRSFEWSSAPLLRLNVFICDEAEFRVTASFHHAILDGWSLSSMLSELFSLYLELRDGDAAPGIPLATTFQDFIALEQQSLRSEETRQYWSEKLAAFPVTVLPPREGTAPREAGRNVLQVRFDSELVEGLKSFARRAGVPLKSVLLAAHCKILGLLSGQSEVTTGLVSNGRPEEVDGDRALGLFLNTIPFSLRLQDSSWLDLAQATAAAENELAAFRRYPLAEMQRARGGQPLFEATFNYTHFHILENVHESADFKVVDSEVFSQINFPFSAGFDLNNSELLLILEHDLTRISVRQIEEIKNYYSRALRAIVADPTGKDNTWALDEAEQQRLLVQLNQTSANYPRDICLHQLIEAQAARIPEAVALVSRGEQTSYAELNERANQLAHYLKSLGVGPEVLVGVMLDRSVEMVVALLGILKAGAAYVPLDPSYPRERVRFMLEDAGVTILLSELAMMDRLPENGPTVLFVDAHKPAIQQQSRANPASNVSAGNLVYVIYTSGTTGRPKGVMLGHREVVNCVLWMQRAYALTPQDRMLCKTTLNFDPSVWEIFWPLLAGGQAVLSQPGEQHDSAALLRTIIGREVTIAYFVPSMLTLFLAEPEVEQATSLRQVICGGESLPQDLVRLFYQRLPQATLHHSYGPTETAIASSETICERDSLYEVTPIGRPLANTQLYVLDQQMQVVPSGVIGELFIGGEGLGRGYLNRPDLTAQKFVPDPFGVDPNGRLYRSGDMVRHLPDGNLEFHGRRDEQVKLRGVRIELGEIQTVIRNEKNVQTALVALRQDQTGDNSLVAYVVAKPGAELVIAELRQKVAQRLPAAMVPAAFVILAELPLLPNGKIDHAALPTPEVELAYDYVAPHDAVEELIAGIWAEVLDLERVSVHNDFFAIGGHSLTATQVMARLSDVFHVDLGLRSLFETPTVAGLAQKIGAAVREGTLSQPLAIGPRTRLQSLPLSFAQQRVWFLEQLESAGAAYHIPVIFRIRGQLDVPALEQVVNEIMRRHESLRTSFRMMDGVPVQVIGPHRKVSLTLIDLSKLPEEQQEAETVLLSNEQAQLRFDLTAGPLMHVRLVRLNKEEHVLQLTLHHLIADGWSVGVLARETRTLYEAFTQGKPSPLPALPVQYADFALWQREWLQGDLLAGQIDYWRRQLAEAPRALELPTDHVRPPVQSFRGAQMRFTLPATLTEELHRLSRREGATIFMTLLAAYAVLLSRYADQRDVVVGTPIANRRQSELEDLIGFFANTLALRVKVDSGLTFRELLRNVREVTLGAYANQDVPFERLVEELQPVRELNRNPFFQATFGVQNIPHAQLNLPGLNIGVQEFVSGATRFDFECFLREEAGELRGVFSYSTDLYEQQTIENLLRHFERLLEIVAANPKERLCDLSLLMSDEEQQLVEWNSTAVDFGRDKGVHKLFEDQVAHTPEAVAVEFGDERLSYAELNRRADELATRLRGMGVGPNTVTGICAERSPAMLVAVLGVLKAGGAYLPLDAEDPARLSYMLENSSTQIVITLRALRDRFSVLDVQVLCVDEPQPSAAADVKVSLTRVMPDDQAYLIYTSDTSGMPNGTAMPHRALANMLHWQMARSGPAPRTLQFAPLDCEVFLQEILSTWCAGGTLVLIDEEVHSNNERLWSTLIEGRIERVFLPCATLQSLAEFAIHDKCASPQIREIITSGEQLRITPQVRQMFAKLGDCVLDNHYGPTAAYVASAYRLPGDQAQWPDVAPIGQPIANSQLYVLDGQMRPGPIGAAGNLYISGDCLTQGYLNCAEATAEKFLPNPFSAVPGTRMYRTGEVARLMSDGNMQLLGRRDGQLKLRGHGVEAGKAETVQTIAETPTAELVADIWAEVLGLERVGLHNNFFDLGGHSLLATRVISRVREAFKLEVPLRRLFEMPTVFEFATYIDGQLRTGKDLTPPPIRRRPHDRPRPLSFAQQRLWFWEQLEPNTPTYNLTSAFRLQGELDLALLEQTLNEIVRRHEILRTSFTAVDGEPVQVVAPRKTLRLNPVDISWLPPAEREAEARRLSGQEALRPFALNRAPLLRVTLLRLSSQEHVAVVSMHHIISDGWSMGIFIDEVTALYEAYRFGQPSPLPDLPVQYADFAEWQAELLQPRSEVLESQLRYWKEQLRDVPHLDLPTDRPRPPVYNPRGAILPLSLPADLLHELKYLSRLARVTLFMTLLAAFKVLLHSKARQDDIVVGTDIANRTRVETEGLIGFFVNMLVLRTDLGGNPTFSELLQRVREITLGAYAHQDVPFAKLVGELHVKRDLSRNPLFQVVFVLQNASIKTLQLKGLTLSPFELGITSAPFDIVLSLHETADGLVGSMTYNAELFDVQTARRLLSDYQSVLERVVADPNQRLSSLGLAYPREIGKHASLTLT